jgi:hypothetical protein
MNPSVFIVESETPKHGNRLVLPAKNDSLLKSFQAFLSAPYNPLCVLNHFIFVHLSNYLHYAWRTPRRRKSRTRRQIQEVYSRWYGFPSRILSSYPPDTSSIGGKHFSRNLRPLDADGNEIGGKGSDESGEDEESEEEEFSEEEVKEKPVLSREERRAAAKAKKEAAIARKKNTTAQPGDLPSSSEDEDDSDDDMPMPANPNHSKAARNQASAPPVSAEEAAEGVKNLSAGGKGSPTKGKPAAELSRREREALQAQQAKERYQKLHEAGKTDEAKADLARLAEIRKKREAEAARKQVCQIRITHECSRETNSI